MLNFVLLNDNHEPLKCGQAIWECDEPRTGERTEIALPQEWLAMLCLQSRRLVLQRDGNMVTGYRLLGGDFFAKENAFTEQMTLWRKEKKTDDYSPKRHNVSRQIWRDFSALLAEGEGSRKPGIVRWLSMLKDQELIDQRTVTFQTAGFNMVIKIFVTDIFQDSLTINFNMISRLGQGWVTKIAKVSCFNRRLCQATNLSCRELLQGCR